jgi:hypothetical protein
MTYLFLNPREIGQILSTFAGIQHIILYANAAELRAVNSRLNAMNHAGL